MEKKKMTFALYFGNRGFFPAKVIAEARKEMSEAVVKSGHSFIIAEEARTRHGAVETKKEGWDYAQWLKSHQGGYDGVIVCLPNFGDENGAIAALKDCGVPILIQAYPDEIGKMDFENRRDAYCGKMSVADVFHQNLLPFTLLEPHVVHPSSDKFAENLRDFAAICRVVNGMKSFTIGAIGARTSKFKTVRYDEITLQKKGITVETFDLSELFYKMEQLGANDEKVTAKKKELTEYADFSKVPENKVITLSKMSVIFDEYITEHRLDCLTIRCWEEMQTYYGIAPCVLVSQLNDRGIPTSCEIDLCSVINMYALQLASEIPAGCVDWNNNYGDDPNKVILFHCGPIAQSLMRERGIVGDHKMFSKEIPDNGWGINEGRIGAFPMTYSNCTTEDGRLNVYISEGEMTDDPIEDAFFGTAGVAKIPDLQPKLVRLGQQGFRHHTVIGKGLYKKILEEAFDNYLNYNIIYLD